MMYGLYIYEERGEVKIHEFLLFFKNCLRGAVRVADERPRYPAPFGGVFLFVAP